MRDDEKENKGDSALAGFAWLLFLFLIFGLAIYGVISWDKQKDNQIILEAKDIRINHLELKVERLENCCRWSAVLEQILPPLAKAELDVMVEQLKQDKERGARKYK